MVLPYTINQEINNIFAHYRNEMDTIRSRHETGEDPRFIVREITEATDTLVLRLLLEHLKRILHCDEPPRHILLLAQGGFGRRHQHPYSDIDLLFLYNEKLTHDEKNLVGELFRTLFDLGFKVGHCCRGYKEALTIAQSDHQSQTAMAESRFLAGDWRLFERFQHDLWRVLQRNQKDLIQIKIREREERYARYGSTINITEPNVKESPGGLRGFHFGLWLGSLWLGRTMTLLHLMRSHLIDDSTMNAVDNAVAFLWRLRNDLHFTTGKEQDVLAMSLQQNIARRLGYQDRAGRLAEEEMMRDYYGHALTIARFADHMTAECTPKPFWSKFRLVRRNVLSDGFTVCDNKICIPEDIRFFEHDPRRILSAFLYAAEQKALLASDTEIAIQDNLEMVDQAFLHDKQNEELLRRFFSLTANIEPALQIMRRIGLLEHLFPEWRNIAYLVRYDLVHRYTVDEHSLLCLYHLEHLRDDRINYAHERSILWRECKEKDVLRLAVLFHDIGKGRDGDHTVIGAQLVEGIAKRMRLPEEKCKRLIFLVRYHLLMSHTAQHRDLSDPLVAQDFSDTFSRAKDLDMMYLLTYVDMRSVSPEGMTEWKNNLLWQLYLAAREIFLSESPTPETQHIHAVSRREKLVQEFSTSFQQELVEDHFDLLPPSYLLNLSSESIRQHLEMIQQFDGQMPVTRLLPHIDSGCRELLLVCKDRVGLFNRLCTSVMLENFGIVEARLNTRLDGIVCNSIIIRDTLGNESLSESRCQLLLERIKRILTSEGKTPPVPKSSSGFSYGRSSFENSIKISNDSSTRFTVIVVRCADRHGLLQDLTSILSEKEVNIYFARIITEGNRVTDVFYVADSSGEKIVGAEILTSLQSALQERLEPAEQHAFK